MSKESAMKFLDELAVRETLQKKLDEMKPASVEELISFAKKEDYDFTREELKEVLAELGAIKLSDDELDNVSAGAFPAAVNDQITDSIAQANVKALGGAPAVALGNFYQATAHALAQAAHNATTAQQQTGITAQASTTMGVATLYTIDTASKYINDIFSQPNKMQRPV